MTREKSAVIQAGVRRVLSIALSRAARVVADRMEQAQAAAVDGVVQVQPEEAP